MKYLSLIILPCLLFTQDSGLLLRKKEVKAIKKKRVKRRPRIIIKKTDDGLIKKINQSNKELLELLKSKETPYQYYSGSSAKSGDLVKVKLLNPIDTSDPESFAVFEVFDQQSIPSKARVNCNATSSDKKIYFNCSNYQYFNDVKKINATVMSLDGSLGIKVHDNTNLFNKAIDVVSSIGSSILNVANIRVNQKQVLSNDESKEVIGSNLKNLKLNGKTLKAGGIYYLYLKEIK